MSEPDEGLGLVVVALIDVLMIMPDLPPEAEQQMQRLKHSMLCGDMPDARRDAMKLSAICETAKRDIGR